MLTDTADKASATDSRAPNIDLAERDDTRYVTLSGRWVSQSVHLVDNKMRQLENAETGHSIIIDMSGVSGLDTAGAWLVERLRQQLLARNIDTQP